MDNQIVERLEQELRAMAAEVGHHVREKGRTEILIERSAETCEQEAMAVQRDLAIQSLDRNSQLLREIKAALERVRNGEYGQCLKCDVPIGEARLRAVPHARHCLACQEGMDRQARSFPFRVAA